MKYFLLLFILVCFSCQTSKESKSGASLEDLKSEVLSIHDEVMPKMSDLRRTRKDLMLMADSIMSVDSLQASLLNTLADDLGNASEGMMQWMRNYEPDFEGTEEEVRTYFEAQKASIQKVKEEMESALKNGQEQISSN